MQWRVKLRDVYAFGPFRFLKVDGHVMVIVILPHFLDRWIEKYHGCR